MSPIFVRLLRTLLIAIGALTLVSAIVNVIAAYSLIGALEEESLNVTRGEVIGWYVGPALLGVALIVLGILWGRRKKK